MSQCQLGLHEFKFHLTADNYFVTDDMITANGAIWFCQTQRLGMVSFCFAKVGNLNLYTCTFCGLNYVIIIFFYG